MDPNPIKQGALWEAKTSYNPKQLEIEYFWPLTEQLYLDLDYSECSPHQYYVRAEGIAGTHGPFNTGMVFVGDSSTWSSTLSIDANTVKFNNLKMPWYRKVLFKLMGFKWNN